MTAPSSKLVSKSILSFYKDNKFSLSDIKQEKKALIKNGIALTNERKKTAKALQKLFVGKNIDAKKLREEGWKRH